MNKPLTRSQFRNHLLGVMDQKDHWAWGNFSGPTITKFQLKLHYQQEFGVYVRDFPVFLARIYGQNPPPDVRAMLAENIYEEDTGRLSLGRSHPELFMKMMKGLQYPSKDFLDVALLPASRQYRLWLERVSVYRDWNVGAAVLTIFVEGSKNDREEIRSAAKPMTRKRLESIVRKHPLVCYHGISPDCMDLTRAHQMVENGHRHDAYKMVLTHAVTRSQQDTILSAMKKTLRLWLKYRESVANACGLTRLHGIGV
ncbi:iron-containing redox enzyme family protein [Candidatus Nitrospira salsa]